MRSLDTIESLENLEESGIKHSEAQAIIKTMNIALKQLINDNQFATKIDLFNLKTEMQAFVVKALTSSIIILSGLQTLYHFLR